MSDIQYLGRETSRADFNAIEALYPLANKRILSQIRRGRVPSVYYQILTTALANSKVFKHHLICDIRDVDNPDMIGEVADLLLRHENINWTICYGFHDGRLLLSIRTQSTQPVAGDVVCKIVSRIGTGVSHVSMASGQVNLRGCKNLQAQQIHVERLRADTAKELVSFLSGKMPSVRVFNMPDKTADMIKQDFNEAADFHTLRHTTGSLLAASGTHPKVAQSIMRHSDINLTMSRYSHIFHGQDSEAVEKLPDLSMPSSQFESMKKTGTYHVTGDKYFTNYSVTPASTRISDNLSI
jgi:hypothetical protein